MKWLTSNLYLLAIIGGLLVAGSVVRVRIVKPHWIALGIGAVLLIAVAIGVLMVVRGTPGQEETVDEEQDDGPSPVLPDSAIERLRLTWNAEGPANWPAAETLAVLSDVAYLPPVEAQKRYRELGFPEFMPIVAGSMIGYVISGEDVTVIVFRGTDFAEVSDWIANLGRSATETPHGSIHSGFYNAYHSMKAQIDQILEERESGHLWVTGHSLGGALALVCTYDLVENERRAVDGIITFGQPMVARRQLAVYLDTLLVGRYARFVNGEDVVARIPSSHAPCGSLVWFTEGGVQRSKRRQAVYGASGPEDVPPPPAEADGSEIEPLTDKEFERLQAEMRASREPARLPDGTPMYQMSSPLIDDHAMSLYLENIRSLLGVSETERSQMQEPD